MKFNFEAEVFEWRGPAPFYFVATPDHVTEFIEEIKSEITYGWGIIPATLTVGASSVTTALIPKNGSYYVPLKDAIRRPNEIEVGAVIEVHLDV